jgi:hypothetical protein
LAVASSYAVIQWHRVSTTTVILSQSANWRENDSGSRYSAHSFQVSVPPRGAKRRGNPYPPSPLCHCEERSDVVIRILFVRTAKRYATAIGERILTPLRIRSAPSSLTAAQWLRMTVVVGTLCLRVNRSGCRYCPNQSSVSLRLTVTNGNPCGPPSPRSLFRWVGTMEHDSFRQVVLVSII